MIAVGGGVLPRHGRHHDGGARQGAVQRPHGAVRPPLDRVALATTHNSMSVPLRGWYSSMQERPIADQLDDGIRGLQIDTHYADRLPNGKVRTFFGSAEELRRQAQADGVSDDAVTAPCASGTGSGSRARASAACTSATRSASSAPPRSTRCSRTCTTFLVANPARVVVVINQDYVTPEDFVEAVRDAGPRAVRLHGPVDGEWPTLREMIDSNERVVFLAENQAGGAPWYRLAYDSITEETPYAFNKVAQLTSPDKLDASCEPNRGPEGGAALPREPLDHHRPRPAALERATR